MRFSLAIAMLSFVGSGPCLAENWSHWRGPTGNGAATDAQPPIRWTPTEGVKWKVKVPGRGSGSPIVWGDQVFVVTAVAVSAEGRGAATGSSSNPRSGQRRSSRGRSGGRRFGRPGGGELPTLDFILLSYNRENGDVLWKRTATRAKPHQGTHSTNGFASASPCTDGERVYAHFGSQGLFCYSMDGRLEWSRADFEPMITRNSFGEGSSPTLAGDKILVPWDHEGQSYLYALNKFSGETVWKTPRDEPTEWSTPLVIEGKGGKQVVLNGQNCARSYDLATGKELWRCAGQTDRPAASAVWLGNLVIVGSGHRGSYMAAFRLDGRGNLAGTDAVAWSIERDTPDIASPLLSGGRIYFHKGKTGVLSCLDAATGKLLYGPSRIPGISSTYASPIAAGGHVYLTGRSGTTVVIEDRDELQIVAANSVGEGVDATPAAADDQLFIRGEEHLFCIEAQ